MANKLWFGIPGSHMQWVPCPLIDSTVQRNRYLERLQFENGGGDVKRSPQYQLQYNFNMNGPAHELEGVDAFNRFASGFYGDGLIHLAYPTNFETNMLPAAWASPGLIEQGWKNICANTATFVDTASNTYNQPKRTASWNITTDAGVFAKKATIVIPPTHTLHIGASGSVTQNGGVFVRPISSAGVIGSPTKLTMLDASAATRTNITFAGSSYQAVDVYIARDSVVEPTRTNYIANPSLETNATGWIPVGSATTSRITTDAYVGIVSMYVVATEVDTGVYVSASSLTASSDYTASVYVKGEAGKLLRIGLSERTSGGSTVGTTWSSDVTATGSWQRVSVSRTFGSTGVAAWVTVDNRTAGAHSFKIDAAMLEKSTTAGTYFDGSSADSVGTTYVWTGTPNASTSVETLGSSVTLTSMMAQLYKTGTTPQIPSHHIMGEGATGLEFIDDAIVETYSYMYPPRKGIATSLVEVEAWR